MEIEQIEIRDYLATVPPMDSMDADILDAVTRSIEIAYARRGRTVLTPEKQNKFVYLVRTGALEVCDETGVICGHFDAGDWVGYRSVMRGGEVIKPATAIEDSLLYLVPGENFLSLMDKYEAFNNYFTIRKNKRIRSATLSLRNNTNTTLISTCVKDLIRSKPLKVETSITIQDSARLMKEKGVTAMLVMDHGKLKGILTDRAFCTLVAAEGVALDRPVAEIMTPNPITIPAKTAGSEALLIMARHNIRHLPVVKKDKIVGVLTSTDLIHHQSKSPIYLINEIHRATKVKELEKISTQLPDTLVHLVENSLTAYDIGHAISSVGRAINQKLLAMAEKQLGTPPVDYTWVIAGSPARNEQTVHTDQDNALILSDEYDEKSHGPYFEQLAEFVSDGLDRCGYIYCPGDVMATNPKWRQPLAVWRKYFRVWIDTPKPKALMYASIFFDLRCCGSNPALLNALQEEVYKKTIANTFFLAYMAANALHYHPPLGLFRKFVLEKTGKEEKALNLKRRGVVPIIDLARVYALSSGVPNINTRDRLEAAYEAGTLSREGMADLKDALEFISTVRLQNQARQIKRGEKPDNYVPPEQLSSLERHHMKDAFEVVTTLQSVMKMNYHSGNLS